MSSLQLEEKNAHLERENAKLRDALAKVEQLQLRLSLRIVCLRCELLQVKSQVERYRHDDLQD